jgi:hypothetical protein
MGVVREWACARAAARADSTETPDANRVGTSPPFSVDPYANRLLIPEEHERYRTAPAQSKY